LFRKKKKEDRKTNGRKTNKLVTQLSTLLVCVFQLTFRFVFVFAFVVFRFSFAAVVVVTTIVD